MGRGTASTSNHHQGYRNESQEATRQPISILVHPNMKTPTQATAREGCGGGEIEKKVTGGAKKVLIQER